MAKKVTSIIVIVSLSLSMFFGGLGLSLRFAKADAELYYLSSLKSAIEEQVGSHSDIDTFFELAEDYIDKSNENNLQYFVMGLYDSSTDGWMISIYSSNIQVNGDLWYSYANGNVNGINHSPQSNIDSAGVTCISNIMVLGSSYNIRSGGNFTLHFSGAHRFTTAVLNGNTGWRQPCPSSYNNAAGFIEYTSIDVLPGSGNWGKGRNLYGGEPEPDLFTYEILVFWLGTRRYITIKDQSIMRQLNGNGQLEYVFVIESDFDESGNFDLLSFQFNDTILLQYSGVEDELTNISPNGVYACDITNLKWTEIHDSVIYDFVNPSEPQLVGQAANIPFVFEDDSPEPGSSGTPDSYSYTWQYFNEYITNYDSTQVIPENLVDVIFGTNGYKIYPCDVSIPSSTIPSGNAFTPNIHTYKWHFTSLPSDLGIDFDLMDVCIIPRSETGNYGLVYFYDDTLAAANKFVDYVDYKDILEQFDIILVVDDELEAIQENAWWQLLVPSSVFASIDYMAVSGSSSYGIEYTTEPLPGNIESGFCIVTKRAIQRMQLYIFNDGISKSYKLMSDFIEKHGLWENSFFEWSQSIFYQLQTIGGTTNDIYNLLVGLNLGDVLDNINRQLERIANNTSEEDPGYWFLSLWNFVNRFSVTDLDFANWVDNYDDFESQIPLPNEDVTPIPIPTITSEVG